MFQNRLFHLLITKPEVFLAVAATIVSVCALGATLYQTLLMREQQHAAVWPRLELYHGWQRGTATPYYRLYLRNAGIGPAIIRQVNIRYRGKSYKNFARLAVAVARQHGLADSLAYQDYSDVLPEAVIPQQEQKGLLFLNREPYLLHYTGALQDDIRVVIQYESLYGQTWEVTYPKVGHRQVE
jgi:hypothetical protein